MENHGKQLRVLAKGLSQIADVLPRIESANIIYPTDRMHQAVSDIYSKIIRFFLRAERWYQQGKLRHAWEALSRPAELYYNDLVQEVEECTRSIEVLANAGAQAEQRDMHLEIQELGKRLKSSEETLQEVRGLLICRLLLQSTMLFLTMRSVPVDSNECESGHQPPPDGSPAEPDHGLPLWCECARSAESPAIPCFHECSHQGPPIERRDGVAFLVKSEVCRLGVCIITGYDYGERRIQHSIPSPGVRR